MAANAAAFIKALGLSQVDVLGFSLGGLVAQELALAEPALVRRLILLGTGPRSGEGMASLSPEAQEIFGATYDEPDHLWLRVFFTPSEASQTAGRAYLKRLRQRIEGRDPDVGDQVAPAQLEALTKWGAPRENPFDYLKAITQPTLVVNGDSDVIIYSVNSSILQQHIPNAQLILYPDANHGSQYQYPERFVDDVSLFLSQDGGRAPDQEKAMSTHPVVLITGALTGIGRATALAFAREGAHVVVSGRRDEEGRKLAAELRELGAEAEFLKSDVRHEDEVSSLVDGTVARFGRLDVAVNAAGTEGQSGPVTELTPENYAATFDTNVLGTLLSVKHEMRVMLAQGSGSIVNISSTMGERGAANASLYTASKHAVEGLTKSAALEGAASGVRVNAIAPGPVQTAMLDRLTGTADRKATFLSSVPLKRAGAPEEIADAIVFIASGKATFITGQIIRVNGGKTAS